MPRKEEASFGPTVRRLREKKGIGLRKFAVQVGISPTFLSKFEREDFPPPGEEKVIAIADALEQDRDEMLALAGRVASDLPKIIQRFPKQMADFLRTAQSLGPHEIEHLARQAEKRKAAKEGGG